MKRRHPILTLGPLKTLSCSWLKLPFKMLSHPVCEQRSRAVSAPGSFLVKHTAEGSAAGFSHWLFFSCPFSDVFLHAIAPLEAMIFPASFGPLLRIEFFIGLFAGNVSSFLCFIFFLMSSRFGEWPPPEIRFFKFVCYNGVGFLKSCFFVYENGWIFFLHL